MDAGYHAGQMFLIDIRNVNPHLLPKSFLPAIDIKCCVVLHSNIRADISDRETLCSRTHHTARVRTISPKQDVNDELGCRVRVADTIDALCHFPP